MLITREIIISIDIQDAIMAAMDIRKHVEDYLDKYYIGKCHHGSMLTRLMRIVECGEIIMNPNDLRCIATISVRFEAECIVYSEDESIHGCEVINVTAGEHVICSHPNASIIIGSAPVNIGQIIPIQVGATLYTKTEKKIALNAKLYIPNFSSQHYRIIAPVLPNSKSSALTTVATPNRRMIKQFGDYISTEQIISMIDDCLLNINDALASKELANRMKFFINITSLNDMNSAIEEHKASVLTGATIFDYYNMAKEKKTYNELIDHIIIIDSAISPFKGMAISRPYVDNKENTSVVTIGTRGVNISTVIDMTPNTFMNHVLSKYLIYLQTVYGFFITYNTEELLKQHTNIWKLYGQYKAKAKAEGLHSFINK